MSVACIFCNGWVACGSVYKLCAFMWDCERNKFLNNFFPFRQRWCCVSEYLLESCHYNCWWASFYECQWKCLWGMYIIICILLMIQGCLKSSLKRLRVVNIWCALYLWSVGLCVCLILLGSDMCRDFIFSWI